MKLKKMILVSAMVGHFGFFALLGVVYGCFWKSYTDKREQPIAFSHKIHANLAECTDCHQYVGKSIHATVPPVEKCMGCHDTVLKRQDQNKPSPEIKKVREHWFGKKHTVALEEEKLKKAEKSLNSNSLGETLQQALAKNDIFLPSAMVQIEAKDKWSVQDEDKKYSIEKNKKGITVKTPPGTPINWVKINAVPEFIYFPHKRHIQAGVDCTECHGRVKYMEKIRKISSMKMGFCITCHAASHHTPMAKLKKKIKESTGDTTSKLKEQLAKLENDPYVNKENAPRNCWTCHK